MSSATLHIDLGALVANWRALDALTACETGAVVKADAYGLGMARVAPALANAGARQFFVAQVNEAVELRKLLGKGPQIFVFSGHMPGDSGLIGVHELIPLINSVDQMLRHVETLPDGAFGIQLDSGMNRLGMEPAEWAALRDIAVGQGPSLIMSHLACGDEPGHPMNPHQLNVFNQMASDVNAPLSLAATAGILLGAEYHFDLTRPGIGLYGGAPYGDAYPVVALELPIIQVRDLEPGETVGYGNTWVAQRPSRIATLSAGYADGLIRALGGVGGSTAVTHYGDAACPVVGRVSMDLITVDVTDLEEEPTHLSILDLHQGVDALAQASGTIGYEILTSLGGRYTRMYRE